MKVIWKQQVTLNKLNNHRVAGLAETLEIQIVAQGSHWLMAEMPVTSKHLQPLGIVHGGATAALAETVASIAGWLCVDGKSQTIVGLTLNINHIRAVRAGVLMAKARAKHVGRSTQVWQIDIVDQDFKQVSSATLTITVISVK